MPFSSIWSPGVRALSLAALSLVCVARLAALPLITQQPQSATGAAGTAVSLSVAATGSGPLTYQWRRDGVAVASATSALFPLIRPSQVDSGNYDVLVKDSSGTTTSSAAALRIGPSVYPDSVTPHLPSSVALETYTPGSFSRLVTLADGRYYVAGEFSSIAGQRRAGLARFKSDATLDDSFNPVALDGKIADLVVQPDGRLVVVGDFRTATTPASSGIARLNIDGSLDSSFAAGTGFAGSLIFLTVGAGTDGTLFVAGGFSSYQGQTAQSLVKLDATGALDRSYAPPRFDGAPNSVTTTSDGKLYCVGASYEQAGVMRTNRVCRLLANGSIDTAFDAGAAAESGVPSRILRQQDGRLLLTGFFANFGGATNRGIARLSENGSVDRSFNLGLTGSSDYVGWVAQAANGDLLLSGTFSGSVISGSLARVKPDGSVDRSFTPPALGSVDMVGTLTGDRIVTLCAPLNLLLGRTHPDVAVLASSGARLNPDVAPRFPAEVTMMRLLPDGEFLIAGTFSHWNGTAVAPIVRVNSDLTLDPSFRAAVNANTSLRGAAVQPDGKIVVVGPLTAFGANSQVRRLNSDGTADASFRTSNIPSTVVDNPIILPDGRVVIPDYLAQPTGLRMLATDGAAITTNEFAAAGAGYPAMVHFARTANGQFLVSGGFGTWAGQAKPKLVRLNADGSVDSSLTMATATAGSMLYAMGFDSTNNPAQSSGRIILQVWGTASSVYTPALLGLQANGQIDPAFVPALPALSGLRGHAIQADDRLLVWAQDTPAPPVAGDPLVARLLANGARDSSFAIVGEASAVNRNTLAWSQALTLDSGDMVAATRRGSLIRFNRVVAPLVTTQPVALTRQPGESATFSVAAAGAGTLSYQWSFNGVPIAGATSATFTLPFALSANAGRYQAIVTNANGSAVSADAVLAIDTTTGADVRLTNLSVRANLGTSPLIAGFAVAGGARQLLVRGIGPGLAPFGVTGTVADPRIVLYSGDTIVDQNDNWGGTAPLGAAVTAVGAFPLSATSLDAMLLRLISGPQTVQLSAATGSGVGLVEVYDATAGATTGGRLINLSARYQVGTGGDVLIAGFTIGGSGNKALLVRGIGPGLAAFGVPGTLVDPQIAVYSGSARIAENDDWGGGSSLTTAFAAVGAFALAPVSKDAALLISLPAGSYTVQLSGVGGTVGEGLIEIYEVP